MADKEKYPIGIQSFESLRNGGYVYVDKTSIIYELVNRGKYIFLSRPRRFGKSLLLSTIRAYFEGRKELFQGLAISRMEQDWPEHPVLHLDLSGYRKEGSDSIRDILGYQFSRWEEQYGIDRPYSEYGVRFRNIIEKAYEVTGQHVVVLVDEYDAPLVAHIEEFEKQKPLRDLLRSVYTNLKICDEHIRFGMLAGVTRFSRTTIFSGLNNLNDISLDNRYSEICGLTEAEIKTYFPEGVRELAHYNDILPEAAMAELKANYDGYHFTRKSADIYNPFSLLLALSRREILPFWYDTARPSFVVRLVRQNSLPLARLMNQEVMASTLTSVENYEESPESLLFQTGYLTIKGYDREDEVYRLGIPNREVEEGIMRDLAVKEMSMNPDAVNDYARKIRKALNCGDPETALHLLKAYLAGIPYHLGTKAPEMYFENNLYIILSLVGMDVNTEEETSSGRLDMVVRTPKYIYLFEFKLDKAPETGMRQIEERHYADKFAADPRSLIRVAIRFSSETKNIDTWIIR